MFGDKITQSVSEAVKKVLATEKLHPNQQKLDVHEPEKDKLTKKDFEMLRSNKKPKNEAFNPLKHIVNPSPAVRAAAKDVKRGSYADRAALMKAGGVKDDRGPRGVTQEDVLAELSVSTLSSYGKKAEKSNDKKLDKAADHSQKATNLYDRGTASAVDKAYDHEYEVNKLHKQVNKRNASMDQAAGKLKNKMSKGVAEASFYGNDKMTKAAQDSGDSKATVRMRDAKGTYTATMVRKQGEKDHKEISRVYDKKDVKEEIEQIDELSTKTLANAAKSASDPDSDYSYGKSHDPQKFADHAKKTKDAKSAAAVQGAADAKGHYPRDNRTQGYDKLANRTPARVTAAGKANKQDVNKLKGNIKRNEEVEEAVESPFTSYKKPREIESRGGSGIKLGSRYGGGKQKDEPTQDEAPKTKKPKGMKNFKEMFGE